MVDTKEFKQLFECIISGQVPCNDIAFYLKNKKFYQYYNERKRLMTNE